MIISIIIPTHNRLGKVCRALDSVLNQSYKNFEVIIVDDGSIDGTRDNMQRYNDSRLKYFWIENGGVARARNFGVKQAQADWICFLDSDDVWRKHKLSEQLRYHARHPDCLISQTGDMWIRNSVRVNKRKINEARAGNIFAESLQLCLISCSSVMMSKKLFYDCGTFDETLPACEDYDLWLRITARNEIGFVPKDLVTRFGGHSDQLSKTILHLDRYRVVALQKLLEQNDLNEMQRQLVKEELKRKYEKNIYRLKKSAQNA